MTCMFLFETVFSSPGCLQTPYVADGEPELLLLLSSGLYCSEHRCVPPFLAACLFPQVRYIYIDYPQLMEYDLQWGQAYILTWVKILLDETPTELHMTYTLLVLT